MAVLLLLWVLNAVSLLIVLTLPITMVTLGLFLLVVNALVFWFAGSILQGFHVDGFGWAFLGALVYSLVSAVLIGMLA